VPAVNLTYRYPTKRLHRALDAICEQQRLLYNAALEERIDCYRKTGKALSARSVRSTR
jgi:putative transposase